MRVAAEADAVLQVGVHFGRLQPAAGFVDRQLDGRVFQVGHELQHVLRATGRESTRWMRKQTRGASSRREVTISEPGMTNDE